MQTINLIDNIVLKNGYFIPMAGMGKLPEYS